MKKWKTNSWRNYPVKHIPTYEDEKELNMVLNKITLFDAWYVLESALKKMQER